MFSDTPGRNEKQSNKLARSSDKRGSRAWTRDRLAGFRLGETCPGLGGREAREGDERWGVDPGITSPPLAAYEANFPTFLFGCARRPLSVRDVLGGGTRSISRGGI